MHLEGINCEDMSLALACDCGISRDVLPGSATVELVFRYTQRGAFFLSADVKKFYLAFERDGMLDSSSSTSFSVCQRHLLPLDLPKVCVLGGGGRGKLFLG
jgi:hypothetical protein